MRAGVYVKCIPTTKKNGGGGRCVRLRFVCGARAHVRARVSVNSHHRHKFASQRPTDDDDDDQRQSTTTTGDVNALHPDDDDAPTTTTSTKAVRRRCKVQDAFARRKHASTLARLGFRSYVPLCHARLLLASGVRCLKLWHTERGKLDGAYSLFARRGVNSGGVKWK